MTNQLTVNFHLTKKCNYKCSFCYAHFKNTVELSFLNSCRILYVLSKFGIRKINFAGGEPFLYKGFGELLKLAKELGFVTSIITNGSLITQNWIFKYGHYLDILGISCDSANPITLELLGRGKGESIEKIKRVFSIVDEFNESFEKKIYKKLNSVITRINFNENMIEFVQNIGIKRWKIFQVLHILNENDQNIQELSISEAEFQSFVNRHIGLKERGIDIISESNENMTESYLMINPEGKFYQNSNGKYTYSSSILQIGVESALSQILFKFNKFIKRGGSY